MRLRHPFLGALAVAQAPAVDNPWRAIGHPSPHSRVNLRIGLAHNDTAALQQKAVDIASPSHSSYRQHLSADDVASMLQPSDEALDAVESWLQEHGIHSKLNKDWLEADVSVSKAQLLLNTSYTTYRHIHLGNTALRSGTYQIPESIRQYIDFVAPTTQFPLVTTSQVIPQRRSITDDVVPGDQEQTFTAAGPCGDGTRITLDCIRFIYNISYTPSDNRTSFAVYGTQEAWLNQTDLSSFLERYNPEAAAANATFDVEVRRGSTVYPTNSEANLDTQVSLGLGWPVPGVFYLNGQEDRWGLNGNGTVARDDYLEFLHELIYNASVPSVITTSNSINEELLDYDYANRVCNMYAAAGARGVTIINSAGDNGAQGGNPALAHKNQLAPTFPSSCPYVTSVGATILQTTDPFNESAATIAGTLRFGGPVKQSSAFATSGGFSNYFGRPTWQDRAVGAYIEAHVPSAIQQLSGFNASGRGFPDVSAVGFNIATVIDGEVRPLQGSSASAPLWAALVALLNDYEISRGNPPLGFLNPLLYSLAANGTGLIDITDGGSNYGICIGSNGGTCPPFNTTDRGGYRPSEGWDAVTGLGVPDFGCLMDALP